MLRANSEKYNIVLIVQDSVRAQNLSLYDYKRKTTPYLEAIAEQSVTYDNYIATAPSTVPTHASLFSGTHLSTHRAGKLSPNFITLADVLKDNGYVTYGLCYQDDVSPTTGLDKGFMEFHSEDEPHYIKKIVRSIIDTKPQLRIEMQNLVNPKKGKAKKQTKIGTFKNTIKNSDIYKRLYWFATKNSDQGAGSTEKKIYRFLTTIDKNEPFFMYIHYDETHIVYRPPMPYRYKFFEKSFNGKKPWLVNQDRHKFFTKEVEMDHRDFEILKALYDGAIAYLDKKVFDVFKMFEKMNLLDNTMFIILSDHGDNIGEHEMLSHKWCLYDTLIKVPLVIKYPKPMELKGEVSHIAQHTDILPTILDMLNINEHNIYEQIEGNSLISSRICNRDKGYAISELINPIGYDLQPFIKKLKKYDRTLFSIRTKTHKYVWASDGKHEFYDLLNDPEEKQNIINSNTKEVVNLQKIAESHQPIFENSYKKNYTVS